MKKFLVILAALSAFICSCTKEATTPEPEMVNVTFDYKMVESNSMVRSATDEQIISAIKSLLPESITISLKSVDGISYSVKTGTSTTLPLGTYTVDYKYEVFQSGYNNYAGYCVPSFDVKQTVVIDKNIKSVLLNAEYSCYAVVADASEVKSLSWKNINKAIIYSGYSTVSNLLISFISVPSVYTWTMGVESTSEFVQTSVNTTMGYESDAIKVEYGKYYFIHPEKATKSTITSSVTYPDWVSGGSNI